MITSTGSVPWVFFSRVRLVYRMAISTVKSKMYLSEPEEMTILFIQPIRVDPRILHEREEHKGILGILSG